MNRPNLEYPFANAAKVAGTLRQELIPQSRKALSVQVDGLLPSKSGTFPLGDRGARYFEEIRVLKQLGMCGKDGCLRLFLATVKLGAQGLKLPRRFGQGVIEQSPLLIGRSRFLFHLNLEMAYLVDRANRYSG